MLRGVAGFLVVAACIGTQSVAQAFENFDSDYSMVRPSYDVFAKWREVQARIAKDAGGLVACRQTAEACTVAQLRLQEIADAARARQGRARLGEVNRAINLAIRPVSDVRRFGMADVWSSPLDTLQARQGDCEDYAILKYLALREAGYSAADLQLLIVRDGMAGVDHAVLVARLSGRWLVLDNRGFALAELDAALHFRRYRLLTQLSPETDTAGYASAAASDVM